MDASRPRWRRRKEARPADIVAAALETFSEKGFAAAHTAEIALLAGVTERTLFRYFPTKDALYGRVMFPAILAAALPQANDRAPPYRNAFAFFGLSKA